MLLTTSKQVAQQVRKTLQLLTKKEPEKTTEEPSLTLLVGTYPKHTDPSVWLS